MLEVTNTHQLDRLRSYARRNGLKLSKSRKPISSDNHGGLMLIDTSVNAVIAGARYDLGLDDAQHWIDVTLAGQASE